MFLLRGEIRIALARCFNWTSVKIWLLSFPCEFLGIFQSFHRILRIRNSLLFRRIPLSQLAYFQFPVISNKEKFVLALVINIINIINIIFPVIYFYDDNPLFSTLKNTSVFCFHGAKCSQAKDKTAYESMQWSKRRKQVPTRIVKMLTNWLTKE